MLIVITYVILIFFYGVNTQGEFIHFFLSLCLNRHRKFVCSHSNSLHYNVLIYVTLTVFIFLNMKIFQITSECSLEKDNNFVVLLTLCLNGSLVA